MTTSTKSTKSTIETSAKDAPTAPANDFKLKPEGDLHTISGKYDCHVYFIHCTEHNNVLLTRQHSISARWMPFTEMPNRSWKDGAIDGFCLVLSGGTTNKEMFEELKQSPPYASFKCMQIFRLQVPQTLKFITRTIYYFRLNPIAENFKCCQAIAPHLEWFSLAIIRSGRVPNLWGPELVECCKLITDKVKKKITEYSCEEAYMYVPRDPPENIEEDMLKSLHITQIDVERLYEDFVEHCFPSFYQTLTSFCCYMSKYKFEYDEARLIKLFAAFNIARNGFLSFHELLLGLACLEPNSTHGEFRSQFIFRYYDLDHTGFLTEEKLKAMVADMVPAENVEEKLDEIISGIGGTSVIGRFSVTEKDFLSAIGSHQIRGTSTLCRLPKSIFSQISRFLAMKCFSKINCKNVLGNVMIKRDYENICSTCTDYQYEMACHSVNYDIQNNMTYKRLPQVELQQNPPDGSFTAQRYSLEYIFNPYSSANAMLKILHEFVKNKGTVEKPLGVMHNRKADFYKLLLQLYHDVSLLLDKEFKCKKVYSPCYVIGDIHGNIEDLLSMERTLWFQKPCITNFIFLGDYVDRGQWGLECALYLVALKILCPNKVSFGKFIL